MGSIVWKLNYFLCLFFAVWDLAPRLLAKLAGLLLNMWPPLLSLDSSDLIILMIRVKLELSYVVSTY